MSHDDCPGAETIENVTSADDEASDIACYSVTWPCGLSVNIGVPGAATHLYPEHLARLHFEALTARAAP